MVADTLVYPTAPSQPPEQKEEMLDGTGIPLIIAGFGALAALIIWNKNGKKGVDWNEPPVLPGELPIIGHAHMLVKDPTNFHQYAR